MHLSFFGSISLLITVSVAGAYAPDFVDVLAQASLTKLEDYLAANPARGNCTIETAARRREWSDLSIPERQEYIRAVQCLQSKPSRTPHEVAPGARSRFDDFVVVHIQITPRVHGTTAFLPWHRYYTWHYEQALRDECGYTGYQPYWNWDRYARDPINSPLFNGNDSSMGGNGAYVSYPGALIPQFPAPNNMVPPADGGGCVTSGPFHNMTVNLGPILTSLPGVPPNPQKDGLGYNPRCLRRDINKYAAAATVAGETYDLITKNQDMYSFQTTMEGLFDQGKWGVHIGGHYTIGGDPGGDFFVGPGDPVFWLHHSMIDRVWWLWQLQDLATRRMQVSKTITMGNQPPSRNGTLDDRFGLGILGPEIPLSEMMETMGGFDGEFCYIYV